MSLTIVEGSDVQALTTVERLKARHDFKLDDTRLELMIGIASGRLLRALGRELAWAIVEERIVTSTPSSVILSRYPVLDLISVEVNGRLAGPGEWRIENAAAGIVSIASRAWGIPGPEALPIDGSDYGWRRKASVDVVVRYEAGYILPGSSLGAPTLPPELEAALFDMIATAASSGGNPLIASERLGDRAVTYRTSEAVTGSASADLPASVQAAIDAYKAVRI